MPAEVPTSRLIAFLKALRDTGNATLAAARAGVSRDWAYKKRKQDAGFDRLCREMAALAKARLPVQRRRPRAGGWNPDREQRFLEALAATLDVPIAARQVGMSPPSAYRHRLARADFAWRWRLAERVDHAEMATEWMECVIAMLEGEPLRADAAVRELGIGDVIRLYERSLRPRRRRRRRE